MIDNAFRQQLPRFAAPAARLYTRLRLTPNHISAIGCAIGGLAALCVAQGWGTAAIGLWWLGRLADGTDGYYARETGQATDFGAYFDMVLDMAAYGVMVIGFDHLHPALHDRWMTILFLYVLCITSALALGMQEQKRAFEPRDNRGLRLGAGLAEGGETGIAYTLFVLFPEWIGALTAVWVVVLFVTVVARTELARRLLAD